MSFLKNRTVVGVICILLSLLICFGLTPLFNQSVSQKAEIVRVVQPIRAGDEITESMVQIVEVGGYNLPEDVLRQKESAVGKYATADLAVGDYIIPSKLSDAPAAENAYLYSLDGSQQAISVSIKSFAEGLSGKLQSGDIVSVIAPDYKQQGQTVVPAELQYVEIISVTASSGYHFKIEENRLEDGKYRIKGRHEAVNPISESLQKRFIDNGMPQEVLTQLVGKKSAPSKGKSGSSPAKAGQATPAPKTRSAQSKPPAKPETGKEGGESV